MRCHPNCWLFLVPVLFATATLPLVFGQQTPKPPQHHATPAELLQTCPLDHRIEFILPTITLHVDPNWLGPTTIWNLVNAYGANCPTWPVRAHGLDFGSIGVALDIHTGLGRKLVRFGIGPQRPDKNWCLSGLSPENSDNEPLPRIEDLTKIPPYKGVFGPGTPDPLTRIYLLHHAHAEPGADSTVHIVCGGHPGFSPPGLRGCSTSPDYTYEGLSVAYNLSQTAPGRSRHNLDRSYNRARRSTRI